MYKGLKRMISIILAVVLASFTAVTAFAAENETTDSELQEAIDSLMEKSFNYEVYFFGYFEVPTERPSWSEDSLSDLKEITANIKENAKNVGSLEEVENLNNELEQAVYEMCVDPSNLRWILNYMKYDYDLTGYYDETTINEFKQVYDCAQDAYENSNSQEIHYWYVAMRNQLKKLCEYNNTIGDVNLDGELTIDDITVMQKQLAGITQFNTSQRFVSYLSLYDMNIDIATSWQKIIAGVSDDIESITKNYFSKLENSPNFDLDKVNEKYKYFNSDTETIDSNYLFYTDFYCVYRRYGTEIN